MDEKEKRRFERVPVKIPVQIFLGGSEKPIQGQIENLSEGGAFISCNDELEKGQIIFLRMQYDEPNLFKGKVIPNEETQTLPEGDSDQVVIRWIHALSKNGFGVEFMDLRTDTKNLIHEILHLKKIRASSGE